MTDSTKKPEDIGSSVYLLPNEKDESTPPPSPWPYSTKINWEVSLVLGLSGEIRISGSNGSLVRALADKIETKRKIA